MKLLFRLAFLAFLSTYSATTSFALTVPAIDAGFVTMAGGSAKGDGTISPATFNYSVGWELHYVDGALGPTFAPMERKNYFVFDLSSVPMPIASAALVVYAGTYESTDASETLVLHAPGDMGAALGDAGFLLMENMMGPTKFDDPMDMAVGVAMASFGNLTAGPPIGEVMTSALDSDMDLVIPIDPAFLNSFLGMPVVIGGKLSTLTAMDTPEAIMGFVGPDIPGGDPLTPTLELTLVPEPATATLALLIAGVALNRRRCILS